MFFRSDRPVATFALLKRQSIREINDIISGKTGWTVEEAISPAKLKYLRVFGPDSNGGRVFLTSLPRDTDADVICAFSEVCKHYFRLGEAVAPEKKSARHVHGDAATA